MPNRFEREIKIELTETQREHIRRLTGMEYPFVEMPLVDLAALVMVAVAVGSEALPVTPSAIKQMPGPGQGTVPGSHSSTIEVKLTLEQKEKIRRATGRNISSLRMAPDDFVPAYIETWEDSGPLRVGRTIVVKRTDEAYEASNTDRVIELSVSDGTSQSVFGTGRHPVTQLSVVLLEEYVKLGDRVLDLGTGSGILAVAAAKLGATEVLALDIEPTAVAGARLTVAANDLTEIVEVGQGSIESAAPPYDVVVANIFPGVIIRLASDLAASVRQGGVFICSGLVAARAQDVVDAVGASGFGLEEQHSLGEWVGMSFTRL